MHCTEGREKKGLVTYEGRKATFSLIIRVQKMRGNMKQLGEREGSESVGSSFRVIRERTSLLKGRQKLNRAERGELFSEELTFRRWWVFGRRGMRTPENYSFLCSSCKREGPKKGKRKHPGNRVAETLYFLR